MWKGVSSLQVFARGPSKVYGIPQWCFGSDLVRKMSHGGCSSTAEGVRRLANRQNLESIVHSAIQDLKHPTASFGNH